LDQVGLFARADAARLRAWPDDGRTPPPRHVDVERRSDGVCHKADQPGLHPRDRRYFDCDRAASRSRTARRNGGLNISIPRSRLSKAIGGFMISRFAFLAGILALSLPASARAQVMVDFSKITCEQYVFSKVGPTLTIATWLSGYYAAKHNKTSVDLQAMQDN